MMKRKYIPVYHLIKYSSNIFRKSICRCAGYPTPHRHIMLYNYIDKSSLPNRTLWIRHFNLSKLIHLYGYCDNNSLPSFFKLPAGICQLKRFAMTSLERCFQDKKSENEGKSLRFLVSVFELLEGRKCAVWFILK